MVVRGGNSDLLSEATVIEMQRRHPRFTSVTVPGEGHAPLLRDAPTQDAIARFLSEHDAR
jgi:pimeloyl-ACP methyl ester carboxylesterase